MRFDDRLNTVLKGGLPEGLAAAMQWRQVVDLLAQKPGNLASADVQMGLTRLRDLHERVTESDRLSAVEALHGRIRSAPLLVYLSGDSDEISDAAIKGADLPEENIFDIYPLLPPRAQSFLAARGLAPDNSDMFVPELISLKPDQNSIGDSPAPDVAVAAEPATVDAEVESLEKSQISDLVDKIANYKREQTAEANDLPASAEGRQGFTVESINNINFETDETGTVVWTAGSPQGAVVGVSIAQPTFDDGPGPDAYGAAAFRQRMPFENARMRLCGADIIAGDWRMSAVPYFGEATGRFEGYRGIMRRPNVAEDAGNISINDRRREQLQQLIHELRTPLNAIIGFSEIIEQQLFGPASIEYRRLANNITDEARRLLTGFEDLEIAAKVDSGQMIDAPGIAEPAWLFERMTERLQGLTHSRSVELRLSKSEPVRPFAQDEAAVERIFARLLSAAIISCEAGEILSGELHTETGNEAINMFKLSRPSHMRGIPEAQLLDPSQGIDEDGGDSSLLGLGFSLRLVRNLAQSAAGSLTISEDKIALTLPAVTTSASKTLGAETE